ncbi:extracellular calcium-sensing receptor-like [Glandiceps talaboti]
MCVSVKRTLLWIVFTYLTIFMHGVLGESSIVQKVSQHGDIMIGGLFSFHSRIKISDNSLQSGPIQETCTSFDYKGFRRSQAMIYAIEEINRRNDILPNISLGYEIRDTCSAVSKSLQGAIDFVASLETEEEGLGDGRVLAVVGASNSATSVPVASVMGIVNIPMISYSSTSRLLSDRILYKSFFRTVPSDASQAVAMAELVKHFGWNWVGTIAADDSYGRPGIEQFIREAEDRDVCISFRKLVTSFPTEDEIQDVVTAIKENPDAKVLVTFIHFAKIKLILEEVARQGITDRTWIASEAWADNNEVATLDPRVVIGTHGILLTLGEIPGFGDYLQNLNPFHNNFSNPFLNELWENSFDCSFSKTLTASSDVIYNNMTTLSSEVDDYVPCSIDHRIDETPAYKSTGLWGTYRTYLAVYAIAQALDDIRKCKTPEGLLHDGACPRLDSLEPWQLLKYVSVVNFTGTDGRHIHFSDVGDVDGLYHIVNWQQSENGDHVDFVNVGMYDGSARKGVQLSMDDTDIVWSYGSQPNQMPPVSVCSDSCQPGTRKGVIPGAPNCCFECVLCLDGEISNDTGATTCIACSTGYWSNENNTKCEVKDMNYLSWDEVGGIIVVTLASLGILLSASVVVLFVKFATTPVVKASNRDLSFLLLTFVIVCFVSVFAYVGLPNYTQCLFQTPLRSCGFTGCVSILLVKTHSVLTIFEAKLPSTLQKRSFVGTRLQILVVLVLVIIQLLIYIIASVFVPPKVVYDNEISKTITYVECDEVSVVATVILILYTWTIAGICLGFAIKARKLPENFNETKHIMFSMLVYFVVWLTYFPAFIWTYGKYKAISQCVVLLASAYGMLFCVFGPKCYIIVFKPQLNTQAAVRKLTMQHSARRASSIVDAASGRKSLSSMTSFNTNMDGLRVHTCSNKQDKVMKKSSSAVRFNTENDVNDVTVFNNRSCESTGIDNPIDVTADEKVERKIKSVLKSSSSNSRFSETDQECTKTSDLTNTDTNSRTNPVRFHVNSSSDDSAEATSLSEPSQRSNKSQENNISLSKTVDNGTKIDDVDCDEHDGRNLDKCENFECNNPKITVTENEVSENMPPSSDDATNSTYLTVSKDSSFTSSSAHPSVDLGDDDVFLTPHTNEEFFRNYTCNCSICRTQRMSEQTGEGQKQQCLSVDENVARTDKKLTEETRGNITDGLYVTIEAHI